MKEAWYITLLLLSFFSLLSSLFYSSFKFTFIEHVETKCNGFCTLQVYNVNTMRFPGKNIEFATSKDHSKWVVSKDNGNWLCIGDINRQVSMWVITKSIHIQSICRKVKTGRFVVRTETRNWLTTRALVWPLWNNRFRDDIGYVPSVVATIPFPFHECDLPNETIYRVCYKMSNIMGATCGSESAYPSGAPEIIPSFLWCSCGLVFRFLCCFLCTILPMRQQSTRDQIKNYTYINNYRSPYGLQQWAKPIPHCQL